MKQQIDRPTSLRNAFANAAYIGILAGLAAPATAIREYDTIKMSLLRSAEGTREWEKYCNRNGFYHTHSATDFLDGKSPSIKV